MKAMRKRTAPLANKWHSSGKEMLKIKILPFTHSWYRHILWNCSLFHSLGSFWLVVFFNQFRFNSLLWNNHVSAILALLLSTFRDAIIFKRSRFTANWYNFKIMLDSSHSFSLLNLTCCQAPWSLGFITIDQLVHFQQTLFYLLRLFPSHLLAALTGRAISLSALLPSLAFSSSSIVSALN